MGFRGEIYYEPFKIQYRHFGEWKFSKATFVVNEWGTISKINKEPADVYFLSQLVTGQIKVRSLYAQLPKTRFDKAHTINDTFKELNKIDTSNVVKTTNTDFLDGV